MLSAIVLTRDEEKNIAACLATLSWADEILVIDSESSDRTCAIAEEFGATVFQHPFTDFASQRNFALQQAKGEWAFFVDADERVTPELSTEIPKAIDKVAAKYVYAIPRKTFFFGKLLRFSDARNDAPIRLFPREQVQWTQPVHEKIATTLLCKKLNCFLLHYSTRDFSHYRQKIQEYVPLELATMREKGIRPSPWNIFLRPIAKFTYLYCWRGGILDGLTGFQYAILSAYYSLLKHWRYWKTR